MFYKNQNALSPTIGLMCVEAVIAEAVTYLRLNGLLHEFTLMSARIIKLYFVFQPQFLEVPQSCANILLEPQ